MTLIPLPESTNTMPSMNEFLSSYFATNQAPSNEALEKQAQTELFCKLAAQNGIDLDKLSQEQIDHLWTATFSKEAEFPSAKEEDKKDKVEEAKEEHDKKKEAAAKIAEADFLGRYMAHSMVDEIRKLASATPAATEQETKEAGEKLDKLKHLGEKALDVVSAKRAREGVQGLRNVHSDLGKHLRVGIGIGHGEAAEKAIRRGAQVHNLKEIGKGVAPHAAAAGAAAAGAAAVHHSKKKESSALDELAGEAAVIKAAEAGFNSDEAAERVSAVLTLGLNESEKIAHVQDLEGAVEVRSLELLEAAGYPVTWG